MNPCRRRVVVVLVALLSTVPQAAAAQGDWTREYEKREVLVPMRDGVRLHTTIYAPVERSRSPILLRRTPYSCAPYGPGQFPEHLEPDPLLTEKGYVFVCQDVRGTHRSEGTWVHMRPHRPDKRPGEIDESTDGYDTVEWLVSNVPGNNGRVAILGASYPGFYAAASMIDAHPSLTCAVLQAPQVDWWYEDVHHHGAFFLAPVFWFVEELGAPRPGPVERHPRFGFRPPTPDGYAFFLSLGPLRTVNESIFEGRASLWNDIVQHPNRDAFWQARDLRPHLRNVAPAVLNVGGWYDDSNLFGTLHGYRTIEEESPESFNVLVIGPWEHTGWDWSAEGDRHGDVHYGQATSQLYRFQVQAPFLEACLGGDGTPPELPEALVFDTGAYEWERFSSWPPNDVETRILHFGREGILSWERASADSGFDEFPSDPAKPVPFTEEILPGRSRTFMNADQRFASRRPDVLVYRTPPLDEPVTLAGPLLAELQVSTSQADADWVVKLVDEHPGDFEGWPEMARGRRAGGYQMLVRGEVLRGRFRNDPAQPEPFDPNAPTRVSFVLPDVLHTFRRGHRIQVQIQSSWFPLVDRNPQSWVENIFEAEEKDFVRATHRIYRTSRVSVGVLAQP